MGRGDGWPRDGAIPAARSGGAMDAGPQSPSLAGETIGDGAKWPPALGSPPAHRMHQMPTSGSFAFAAVGGTPYSSSGVQSPENRLADFQRNYAFIGFMLVVCTGGLVFLLGRLREVLEPLGWAAFFAMPLTGFISLLDAMIVALFRQVCFCVCKRRRDRQAREKANRRNRDVIDFRVRAYEGHIRLSEEDAARLLRKVNRVGEGLCAACPVRSFMMRACTRHVSVTELHFSSEAPAQALRADSLREVNRIVKGWKYYVRREDPEGGRDQEGNQVLLGLYLDKAGRYPAIADPARSPFAMRGKVEVDKSHIASYVCAVLVAMMWIMVVVIGVMWLISVGEKAIESNVKVYVKGGRQLVESLNEYAQKYLPHGTLDGVDARMESAMKERLPELASAVLEQGQGFGFEILLFLLYLLFWVLEPLPVNTRVSGVFKTYLLQKTLVCLIFATMVSLLLLALQCKIWHILFLVAFLLNYIPEIGALMCFVIMMPLLLLDGTLSVQTRMQNALWFMVLFLAAKFITGNVIEVQLYAKSGGDLMRMHPVVMLALMMLFESLLGITGKPKPQEHNLSGLRSPPAPDTIPGGLGFWALARGVWERGRGVGGETVRGRPTVDVSAVCDPLYNWHVHDRACHGCREVLHPKLQHADRRARPASDMHRRQPDGPPHGFCRGPQRKLRPAAPGRCFGGRLRGQR